MKWWQGIRVKMPAGVAAILALIAALAVVSDHLVSIGKAVDWATAFFAKEKPVVKKPMVTVRDVVVAETLWGHNAGWMVQIEAVVANDGGDASNCDGELKVIEKSIEQNSFSAKFILGGDESAGDKVKIIGGGTQRSISFVFGFADDAEPFNKGKFRIVCDGVVTPLVDVTIDPKWQMVPDAQQPSRAAVPRAAKRR